MNPFLRPGRPTAGRRRALSLGWGALLSTLLAPLAAQPEAAAAGRLRWRLERDARRLEVGEVIMLRLEVWVSTWFQAPVDFPATLAADGALVEAVGGSPDSGFEDFKGQRWTGLSRRYRVMAVQPGELQIRLPGPLLAQPGAGRPLQLAPPPPLLLQVRVPAGAEDIQPFVAARRLELRQRWWPDSVDGRALQVGDLVRREIVLVTDSSSPLLPAPDFGQPAGVAVHVQATSVEEQRVHAAATAVQTQRHQAVYTLQQAGPVELPAVEWVWWDLGARRRRVSRLEGQLLQVQPSSERRDPFALDLPADAASSATKAAQPAALWPAPLGTAALVAAAGLAGLAWRRRSRIATVWHRWQGGGQAQAWRRLRRACRQGNASAADAALASLLLTLEPALRCAWLADEALASAIDELQGHRFGPPARLGAPAGRWHGQRLWQALIGQRRLSRDAATLETLPLLHP